MHTPSPPITPELRIGELLDAYPELERTLIGLAPEFARLQNPILRKTVAKIATLQQAARIGGLDVRELVNRLRSEVGQPAASESEPAILPCGAGPAPSAGPGGPSAPEETAPDWLDASSIEGTIDADEMLRAGRHPLGAVRQRLGELAPGRVLSISSSFRPVPLIDTLTREGYSCFSTGEGPRYLTYFRKQP